MLDILYFAKLRDDLGVSSEQITWQTELSTVNDLKQHLISRGQPWEHALNNPSILFAVNQSMAKANHPIEDGDEIAFFPPVTGG